MSRAIVNQRMIRIVERCYFAFISSVNVGWAGRGFIYLFEYGNSVIHVINNPRKIKATKLDISTGSK